MKKGFHTSIQLAYNVFRNMATLQIVHKTFKCDKQLLWGTMLILLFLNKQL